MKIKILAAIVSMSISSFAVADSSSNLIKYANPMIGTNSHGDFSHGNKMPYVATPIPMTLWTPQMNDGSWAYAYYHCSDKDRACVDSSVVDPITGFRQSHLPSPWIGDYGHFSLMPIPADSDVGSLKIPTDAVISSENLGKFKVNAP
ncbi:putative alpha-1,2-mannosidase precursor [Photobacterium sp. SKA34]|uniref:hypothetical protein n=1 Tax=Photobacterium sp. SKA34 TaxID=121723 RepID=UPI00006ABEC0|nr:hypothetical protein [Photobacterium sp. SKA34]EAR53413.1 putative alpha-1,2-mannosidase precursor [Photobacterium sp. SKA34]